MLTRIEMDRNCHFAKLNHCTPIILNDRVGEILLLHLVTFCRKLRFCGPVTTPQHIRVKGHLRDDSQLLFLIPCLTFLISPYSTRNSVRIGYPAQTKTRHLHAQSEPNSCVPNYIPPPNIEGCVGCLMVRVRCALDCIG